MNPLTENLSTQNIPDLTVTSGSSRKEKIHLIGTDFYRAAANIAGLVSLLEPMGDADPDFKDIRHYLLLESVKLLAMAKEICI